MISYAPLWKTLADKGETTYSLIYKHGIDRRTIFRLKHNESVTTLTLEKLCLILDCPVQDVVCISADIPQND